MTSKTDWMRIERVLDPYKNDLWLECRHKMDEVVRDLEGLLKPAEADNLNGPLARSIRSLVGFLRFLELECSGESFADDARQWGQLMNLMEISRKLNHRSVKFKEILTNRHIIELKSGEIRKFNEQARLIRTLEKLIETFESDLARARLLLSIPHEAEKTIPQDELSDVLCGQRALENTLKPTVQNIQLCLQNVSISKSVPSTQHEAWLEKLNSFSRITERLLSFARDYVALRREMAHLRPLVESLEGLGPPSGDNGRNYNLENSIDLCKKDFELVIRFEQKLNETLKKSCTDASRRRSAMKDELNNSTNHQIEIKLIRLLKPTRLDEYSSELYGSELREALTRAVECRRLLDQAMSSLRLEFGRFYFVNDIELLTIISLDWRLAANSGQPNNRRLIGKLFNNSIQEFLLSGCTDQSINDNKRVPSIIGLRNPIGETLLLLDGAQEPIPLRKRVNLHSLEIVRIFNELQRKLQRCLAHRLTASLILAEKNNADKRATFDWLLPIQLLELVERIEFTRRVEDCLRLGDRKLAQLLEFYESRLNELSEMPTEKSVSELKKSALISLVIHFVSTLCELLKLNVSSAEDWNWIKTARYYFKSDLARSISDEHTDAQTDSVWIDPVLRVVEVRLAHSKFPYKFDLLSVETRANRVKRLIYTETSERCFLVASQAIGRFKLGANPFGPAGSGKTETIKALGHLLGCQVIVHNCDQTNTTEALERLIWGLAHTGLWGCFDEFNRLDSGTLSSVSGLLELLQTSLRSSDGARTIAVELNNGQMEGIDPSSAFFITMNPSDTLSVQPRRIYRGRRRLPANLRSLFLPIAMIQVQLDRIVCEMLLASSRIVHRYSTLSMSASLAETFGSKFARWIARMKSDLQIDRCEWDLRLVMTILGRFFRSARRRVEWSDSLVEQTMIECIVKEVGPRLSGRSEIDLLVRSLNETFDTGLDGSQMEALSGDSSQQLDEQLEIRPGVIILGGDTSATSNMLWRQLAARRNKSVSVVGWFQLNPKSCSKRDLLGYFNEVSSTSLRATAKWCDGLLTRLVRNSLNLLQTSSMQQVWLVLSGPIDPEWVESLNSVLDDNQVLTLSSGERLNFVVAKQDEQTQEKCIKLIFETSDISNASPATISRLGLIDLRRVSSVVRDQRSGMAQTELKYASFTILMLPSETERDFCDSLQPARDRLMGEHQVLGNQVTIYEYVCFRRSRSGHLIELLELINANSLDESEQKLLIIHNLHLIECEDDWKTRTFVELLLHVVTTMSYYDHQHNLKFIPPRLHITTTANEDSRESNDIQRLQNVAKERGTFSEYHDFRAHNLQPASNQEISFDTIVNWCGFGQEPSTGCPYELPPAVILVETVHQVFARDLARRLEVELSKEGQTTSSGGGLEICTFKNSTESFKSIETLTKLIEHGENAGGHTMKRRLLLLDSLQMYLLEPELRTQLCFLLNVIKFKGFEFESLGLRCLFISSLVHSDGGKPDSDYIFWLQMAEVTRHGSRQKSSSLKSRWAPSTELSTHDQIREFLESIDANASSGRLVEVLVDFLHGDGKRLSFEQRRSFLAACSRIGVNIRKRAEYQSSLLSNGLSRLAEFDQMVEATRESLQVDEVQLKERKQHIEMLLEKINKELASGQMRSEQLIQLGREHEVKTKELSVQRKELESRLAGVMPKLEASKREIVDCLRPEALNEIKTLRSPPRAIKDILEVLFLVLVPSSANGGAIFMDWPEMKAWLTKFSLRDELTTKFDFEKRLADERLVGRLEHEINSRRQSFQLDQAARASSAIVPIVKWLLATCEYGRALIGARPLTERMQTLELEAVRLGDARHQLELAQKELDNKIASDRKELDKVNSSYEQARSKLDSTKSHLEKAQKVRMSLAKPLEHWRQELDHYESLLDIDTGSLHWLTLVSAALTLHVGNSMDFGEQLEKWLEIFEKHRFKPTAWRSIETRKGCSAHSFLVNCANLLLECMSSEQSDELAARPAFDLHLGLDSSDAKQTDHLLKLLAINLNLHVNPAQLTFIATEPSLSVESLRQYLAHKQILCPHDQDLVLVRPASDTDWLRASKDTLGSNRNAILLIELPRGQTSSMQILDILDSFLDRSYVGEHLKRVVMFGQCKSGDLRPELRQLLREIDLSMSDHQELARLQTDIANHLLEQCEPKLASDIKELELKLIDRREHAKRLEQNLIIRLMLARGTRHDVGISLDPQNELVRLLLELDQMNESLAVGIEQISSKLSNLRAKRDKFRSTSKQLAQFYSSCLAGLKSLSSFYGLRPRQLVGVFNGNSSNDTTAGPLISITEHVMCSMRPGDRQTLLDSILNWSESQSTEGNLDRMSLVQASKRAVDLKHAVSKLIGVPNLVTLTYNQTSERMPGSGLQICPSSAFKLAVILHDARRSSPQMELDEFFERQQSKPLDASHSPECQYFKLYAGSEADGENKLREQLERILTSEKSPPPIPSTGMTEANSSGESKVAQGGSSQSQRRKRRLVKCICVANAHLAAAWINTSLLNVIEANTYRAKATGSTHDDSDCNDVDVPNEGQQLVIVLLVAECDAQNRRDFSSEFDLNLLDEAHLKFWYDELALELVDRWHLYEQSLKVRGTNRLKELEKQLVLFHIVCQELTMHASGGLSLTWEAGENYSFDYEQLCLALKPLEPLADSGGAMERATFCNHIETVVYGARMETSRDERLLEGLVRQLLRYSQLADKNWARFVSLIESTDIKRRRELQSEFMERLTTEAMSHQAHATS